MARINMILGILLGLAAVVSGPIGSPSVRGMFNSQLMEKAVPTPGPPLPDGTPGRSTLEVSPIDRAADAVRWDQYQKGSETLSLYAVVLVALGALRTTGWGQKIGGPCLMAGATIFGGGAVLGAYFDMATLNVFSSIGAILLLAGWGGLLLAAIEWNRTPKITKEASA